MTLISSDTAHPIKPVKTTDSTPVPNATQNSAAQTAAQEDLQFDILQDDEKAYRLRRRMYGTVNHV